MLGIRESGGKIPSAWGIHCHVLNRSSTPCADREYRWEATKTNIAIIAAQRARSAEGDAEYWRNLALLIHCCEKRTVWHCNMFISIGIWRNSHSSALYLGR
jgi:hypothetical protein